jgi:FdhD protein
MTPQAVQHALDLLAERQTMQRQTGATHAAAWLTPNGAITRIREDVGRHNALDKLIGALALSGSDAATGAVLVTSRASYEMVQKTAALGIEMLIAVSAPTAFAVTMAAHLNMTLIGFARPGSLVVYSHPQRLRSFAEGISS